jgi:tagaturonate epimerase
MLNRYSLGTGDRFGRQGVAQLKAVLKSKELFNVEITPVWNKSNREHQIIGTSPRSVRTEADQATAELGWNTDYYVDADHITINTVDRFLDHSNFFTLDVADSIGVKPSPELTEKFIQLNQPLIGRLSIDGIEGVFEVDKRFLKNWADQFLKAISAARDLYEYIRSNYNGGDCLFEVSMDEVKEPQSPIELFFILKTLADFGVKPNTIAPKFTGQFYKGVDYEGDIEKFCSEFEQDILVIKYAINHFDLPDDLKLSVHSGSDKFSLYPHIQRIIHKHNVGLHLKTAGTTWLEEATGLAASGGKGLEMLKKIYSEAYQRFDELTGPYLTVTDIRFDSLPKPSEFYGWDGKKIVSAIEHNTANPGFHHGLRQFFHCSYKIAAEEGEAFIRLLNENRSEVGQRVTDNLFERHIKPLYIGDK